MPSAPMPCWCRKTIGVRFKKLFISPRFLACGSPSWKGWRHQNPRSVRPLAGELVSASPPYEALVGDLKGAYSRRINIQHRLVYQVLEDEQLVKVLRLWSHYA